MAGRALSRCLVLLPALLPGLLFVPSGSEAVDVEVASVRVSIPEDSIVADGSFEGGTSAFTSGPNRKARIVAHDLAPHGSQVLEVTPRRRGDFGIDDWPGAVTDAVARAPYRATAYVAGTGDQVGRTVSLTVRLTGPDGSTLLVEESRPVVLGEGFQRLQATLTPRDHGGHIDVFVSGRAGRPKGGSLLVDAVTLTQGIPVPSGFTYDDEVFRERFGEEPGYDLLDSWNFGLADNRSAGNPWSGTGEFPYWGSGTKGWAPDCDYGTPSEEYNLPTQITQSSTNAPHDAFDESGTGLRITIEPRTSMPNGCLYTWVSGALNTRAKHEFGGDGKTFFVQVRARMPYVLVDGERVANGTWGSIWLLPGAGSGQSNAVEVDLMEGGYLVDGVDPLRVIASNLHTSPYQVVKDSGVDLSDGYHTYGAKLDTATGQVNLYLDGQEYASYSNGPRSPMFLLLNAHVANVNAMHWHSQVVDEAAPSDMVVSEVRVFERPHE